MPRTLTHAPPEPTLPPDAQPRRTDTATREALTACGVRTLRNFSVGVALLVAMTLLLREDPRRYTTLLQHGTRTTAVVQSTHHLRGKGVFFSRIRVAYHSGAFPYTTTVWLGADARRYQAGETVALVYKPDRPAAATVPGEWNVAWWRRMAETFMGLFGALAVAFTLPAALAFRRAHRALGHRPWASSTYTFHMGARRDTPFVFLTSPDVDDSVCNLKLLGPRRLLGPFRGRPPAHVWVASEADGRPVAVATPGAGRIYMVRSIDLDAPWRRLVLARVGMLDDRD